MCGRFSQNISLEQIQQHFAVDIITCKVEPRLEVFPSQHVPAIIMQESKMRLGHLTWGLIPFWAKEKKGTGHINARMETLDQKPSFKDSFRKRRCLIIGDGFYEWKSHQEIGNRKTKYFFQLPSNAPFAFAGLWDTWQKTYNGCTIITREAVGEIRDIHDRMPCILNPEAYTDWLDAENHDVHGLKRFLWNGCVDDFVISKI
ncbi:MAG TPA: SOS response-associated peptidase [Desulfotignum sp.]|nr:SOS response-associated peptidase [Desulfotignum sp.]